MVSKTTRVVREKTVPVRASGNVGVRKKQIVNATKGKKEKQALVRNLTKKRKVLKVRDVEKEVRVKISIKNKIVGKKVEQSLADPAPRKLAIRSPFLFPLPREQTISALARYTGVFFVAVGSLFSLLNLYTIDPVGSEANLASVSTLQSTTNDFSFDQEPDPLISVLHDSGSVDRARIVITVPYAESVHIIARNNTIGQDFPLGYAVRIDDTTWQYDWLTTGMPSGEYGIKVLIQNGNGTYSDVSDEPYVIDTPANTTTANLSPDDSSVQTADVSASSTTQIQSVDGVRLSVRESNPVEGTVPLEVVVADATAVTVHAKNTITGALYFIGSAEKRDETLWKYVWDSEKVPNGAYQFTAKANTSRGSLSSEERTVTVENEITSASEVTVDTVSAEEQETELNPEVHLTLSKDNPISGFVEVNIGVSGAQWIEVYARQKNSLTPFFLGLAKKATDTEWKYLWQTTQSPNSEYVVYVRVRNQFGFFEGKTYSVLISNNVMETFTDVQEEEMETFRDVADTLIKATDTTIDNAGTSTEEYREQNIVYIKPASVFVSEVEIESDAREDVMTLLNEYRARLEVKLNELARAKRTNDETKISALKEEIEQLRKDVLRNLPATLGRTEILEQISSYLSQITYELQEVTVKNEVTLLERVGDAIHKDTDGDDITDYDEVNLYQTNPFTADTDGDGYTDGVEIGMGYDPHASEGQSLIAFESPREIGVIRDDLLVVSSVTNVVHDSEENKASRALITGKGLPNSFVTLFIYSTPLIVTVKTDSDGSWSYILDKELEEGEHEIYAGVTDNAGRIVAKSNPFPFVKTAEAYTGKTERQTEEVVANVEPSLVQGNVMLLVASIAVSALGLVLILLGLHVTGGRKQEMQPALQ